MKRLFLVVTMVVLVGLVFAQGMKMNAPKNEMNGMQHGKMGKMCKDGKMMRGQGGEMMLEMMDELKLTSEQKDQLQDMRANFQKEIIPIEAEIKVLDIDKRQALQDQDFKTAKQLTKKIFDKKEEIELKRIDHHSKMLGVLTDEQLEIFKNLPKGHHKPMMMKKMQMNN